MVKIYRICQPPFGFPVNMEQIQAYWQASMLPAKPKLDTAAGKLPKNIQFSFLKYNYKLLTTD